MTDVEILRRAAGLMRERANAAAEPWHPWGDADLPERSGMEAWQADMKGHLGAEWAEYAASWHPAVALAVADLLDLMAEDYAPYWMEPYAAPFVPVIEKAYAIVRAYLGDSA